MKAASLWTSAATARNVLKHPLQLVFVAAFWSLSPVLGAFGAVAAPSEYQVKAVFVFNFSQFVEWPQETFDAQGKPFVIGVLGTDPFGQRLDEAVKGETVNERPLVVRRFHRIDEVAIARFCT